MLLSGRKLFKEHVASLIGLHKNNGAVSCVDNHLLGENEVHALYDRNLVPTLLSCYGQISIETATFSVQTVCLGCDSLIKSISNEQTLG